MFDSDFPARVEMDFSGHACSSFVNLLLVRWEGRRRTCGCDCLGVRKLVCCDVQHLCCLENKRKI